MLNQCSWHTSKRLVLTDLVAITFAAEYKGKSYYCADQAALDAFRANPEVCPTQCFHSC